MASLLSLLLCGFTVQFSQAAMRDSQTITNYGGIVRPSARALFEYGAESGDLQPPWDVIGPQGYGDHSGSTVTVDSSEVRTGTKSAKIYQVGATRSDAQRRVVLREVTTQHEYYLSWWAYVPSGLGFDGVADQTISFGGWQTFFGPTGWEYYTSGRFLWRPDTKKYILLMSGLAITILMQSRRQKTFTLTII